MKPAGAFSALGGALAGLLPVSVAAQEVLTLDEIVFSAGFEAVAAERTGATVEVLTAGDLAATGEARISDHLDRLPGVEVLSRGPAGTQTGLTIRGLGQNYIAVRVDGIDVTDPSAPQVSFDFGTLTSGGIERIEVLKGSQSAQYGSEAVAGVVDIRTRRATEEGLHFYAEAEYGSFDTRRGSVSTTHKRAAHEIALTYTKVDTDGFSAADENLGNREDDGFEADRVSANGSVTLPFGLRLGFSGFYEDSRAEFDQSGGPPGAFSGDGLPPFGEFQKSESHGGLVFAEFAIGPVDHRLEAQRFKIERSSVFDFFPFDFEGERDSFAWRAGVDLGAATRLVAGADTTEERTKQTGGFSASNHLTGVFAELTRALTPVADVALTVRHDEHSRFGGETTGRLSGVWRAPQDWTLRAAAATGFRAPSNFELFSTSPFSLGDATLKPEESLSLEAGVEKRWGERARLAVTARHPAR
ncbi:MAG: TonB-dependent receptor [Alphaproteobacteria bacterium HGW-Alphaproteobacteria-2]|nr:MAG: TonB-dependent receptor [Alphaproteobacteria bacterium HGW-Alphaproteobacteria-2]